MKFLIVATLTLLAACGEPVDMRGSHIDGKDTLKSERAAERG